MILDWFEEVKLIKDKNDNKSVCHAIIYSLFAAVPTFFFFVFINFLIIDNPKTLGIIYLIFFAFFNIYFYYKKIDRDKMVLIDLCYYLGETGIDLEKISINKNYITSIDENLACIQSIFKKIYRNINKYTDRKLLESISNLIFNLNKLYPINKSSIIEQKNKILNLSNIFIEFGKYMYNNQYKINGTHILKINNILNNVLKIKIENKFIKIMKYIHLKIKKNHDTITTFLTCVIIIIMILK